MELRHLRYFIAVAEELNFSRAAVRLHLSQPPLSRQIRDLEEELQVKLLERDRQSVRLTRIGQAFLIRAQKLIREADALKMEAQSLGGNKREALQIGYAPSPSAVIISEILAQYYKLSPEAGVTLHDLSNTQMMLGLRSKKLDAAVTVQPYAKDMRGLKFDVIRQHYPGIICSILHPLAQNEAVRPVMILNNNQRDQGPNKLVVYRKKDYPEYQGWIKKVLEAGRTRLSIGQECDDVLGVIAEVESNRGVAIVGDFITAIIGDRVRFVPFESKAHFLNVGLLYSKKSPSESTEKLIAAALTCRQSKLIKRNQRDAGPISNQRDAG